MVIFIGPMKAQLLADAMAITAFGLMQEWGPFAFYAIFFIPSIIFECLYPFFPYFDQISASGLYKMFFALFFTEELDENDEKDEDDTD